MSDKPDLSNEIEIGERKFNHKNTKCVPMSKRLNCQQSSRCVPDAGPKGFAQKSRSVCCQHMLLRKKFQNFFCSLWPRHTTFNTRHILVLRQGKQHQKHCETKCFVPGLTQTRELSHKSHHHEGDFLVWKIQQNCFCAILQRAVEKSISVASCVWNAPQGNFPQKSCTQKTCNATTAKKRPGSQENAGTGP